MTVHPRRLPCFVCDGMIFWRYRDRDRWHCAACVICPDERDAVFTNLERDEDQP